MSETITQEKISQQILNALDGRTQSWLVDKVKEYTQAIPEGDDKNTLEKLTDVYLSRKMNNRMDWNDCEIAAISEVLKVEIKVA